METTNKNLKTETLECSSENQLDVLINQAKFGVTQFLSLTLVMCFIFADGFEMIITAFLSFKLGAEWNLSSLEKGALGSSVFSGFFIGSFCVGYFGDKYGRIPSFIVGSLLFLVFSLCSAFAWDIYQLVLMQGLAGLGIGCAVPTGFTLVSEIFPSRSRTFYMNLVWLAFPLGELAGIQFSQLFLDEKEGWRVILVILVIPIVFSLILCRTIYESPRFTLSKGNFAKTFEILEELLGRRLNEQEKDNLSVERDDISVRSNIISLFKPKYVFLVLNLMFSFFCVSFCFYGASYLMPEFLNKKLKQGDFEEIVIDYYSLVVVCLAEIPGILIASCLSNVSFLGRRGTITIGFLLSFIAFSCITYMQEIDVYSLALIKFFLSISFQIIFVYVSEAFPTAMRSKALGVSNSAARIGGLIAPIASQALMKTNLLYPFKLYAGLTIISAVFCLLLPFDTLNRAIE